MKLVISIATVLYGFLAQAQTQIFTYAYDASGNRDTRWVIYLKTTKDNPSTLTEENKSLWKNDSSNMVKEKLLTENPAEITVYPNPTKEMVFIAFSEVIEVKDLRVYDSNGKLHYHKQNLSVTLEVPFQKLKPGGYYIWLSIEGKIKRYKVIKE